MERLGITVILLVSWLISYGQLSFRTDIFPRSGDSLTYQKDILGIPDNNNQGANQTWDFRSLQTPLFAKQHFSPSAFFKDSDQLGQVFIYEKDVIDYLYYNDGNMFSEIGFLLEIGKSGKKIPVYYDQSLQWDTNSLQFGEKRILNTSFEFTLNRADLPKSIQESIPEKIIHFRVVGTKSMIRYTDAWGKMLLPDETIPANRVRIIESTRIRIYNADSGKLIPYFDLNMMHQIIPMRNRERYYEFYSDNYPFVTARIRVDDKNQLINIDYQSRKSSRQSVNTSTNRNDFVLYPNPTYNVAKIFIKNKQSGNYSLAIYNIIGKKLWHRDIEVNGETIIKENFGFLPKGTYLISLHDENGNILKTTRLIIISV